MSGEKVKQCPAQRCVKEMIRYQDISKPMNRRKEG